MTEQTNWIREISEVPQENNPVSQRGKKPPIGLPPKWLWEEEIHKDRMRDLQKAISQYLDEKLPIPLEWVTEYNFLVSK